jgi:hypothetical protein
MDSLDPALRTEETTMETNPQQVYEDAAKRVLVTYRDLSPEELALINEAKALAAQCGAFIMKLRKHPQVPFGIAPRPPKEGTLHELDQRWISIGATDLQRGIMSVIRGIAQPQDF